MRLWGSVVDYFSRDLAFRPPHPPTYRLVDTPNGLALDSGIKLVNKLARLATFHKIRTPHFHGAGNTDIVLAWIPYAPNCRPTLLYSHPNALDLAQCLPNCFELSRCLQVNIMLYDYSGYGQSTGLPSERNSVADITASLEFLKATYGKSDEDILLYGQSVGTGPTVHLASLRPKLAGVVLHSPLLSGIRVLNPTCTWWPRFADIFANYHHIRRVAAPTLILHGTLDEVIHVEHGRQLYRLAQNPFDQPLFADGFNHQNVETCQEYVPRLRAFCAFIFQELKYDPGGGREDIRSIIDQVAPPVEQMSCEQPPADLSALDYGQQDSKRSRTAVCPELS